MIRGIGVDIVDFKRIDLKIARKVLSSKEKEIFAGLSEKLQKEYLAERFAVKEALFKADNSYFNYDLVTVLNNENGKPYLDGIDGFVSIAHDAGIVCAFVVLNN